MTEKIKAIVFDVGGVLAIEKKLSQTPKKFSGVHESIAKKLSVSLDQYFDAIETPYTRSVEGKLTKTQALKEMSGNLKTSSSKLEKYYKNEYNKKFKQNKELYRIAFNLKKQGYKIAILSDQWHVSKEALMPEKYAKKFDEVIVSCDVGMRKPYSKIFKLLIKKMKLKPSQLIFVDNQKWNTKASEKLKIKTILFVNNQQFLKDLKKKGISI